MYQRVGRCSPFWQLEYLWAEVFIASNYDLQFLMDHVCQTSITSPPNRRAWILFTSGCDGAQSKHGYTRCCNVCAALASTKRRKRTRYHVENVLGLLGFLIISSKTSRVRRTFTPTKRMHIECEWQALLDSRLHHHVRSRHSVGFEHWIQNTHNSSSKMYITYLFSCTLSRDIQTTAHNKYFIFAR